MTLPSVCAAGSSLLSSQDGGTCKVTGIVIVETATLDDTIDHFCGTGLIFCFFVALGQCPSNKTIKKETVTNKFFRVSNQDWTKNQA